MGTPGNNFTSAYECTTVTTVSTLCEKESTCVEDEQTPLSLQPINYAPKYSQVPVV